MRTAPGSQVPASCLSSGAHAACPAPPRPALPRLRFHAPEASGRGQAARGPVREGRVRPGVPSCCARSRPPPSPRPAGGGEPEALRGGGAGGFRKVFTTRRAGAESEERQGRCPRSNNSINNIESPRAPGQMEVPRVTAQSVSGEQVGAGLSQSGWEPASYPEQSGRMFFTEHLGIARGFARLIV